jgi:hypothetical protein
MASPQYLLPPSEGFTQQRLGIGAVALRMR